MRNQHTFRADRPDWDTALPARHGEPTDAEPGSDEKILVMQERLARREPLCQPGDRGGFRFGFKTIIALKKLGEVPAEDDAGEGADGPPTAPATPGDRIRQARERLGLNQAEAARLIGVHQATLSRIESRRQEPSLWVLYRAARAFSASIDHLACTGAA